MNDTTLELEIAEQEAFKLMEEENCGPEIVNPYDFSDYDLPMSQPDNFWFV